MNSQQNQQLTELFENIGQRINNCYGLLSNQSSLEIGLFEASSKAGKYQSEDSICISSKAELY